MLPHAGARAVQWLVRIFSHGALSFSMYFSMHASYRIT